MQHAAQEAHDAKAGTIRARLRGLADERDTELLTKELKAQATAEEKKVHAHIFQSPVSRSLSSETVEWPGVHPYDTSVRTL